jgi:predicted dehydrogenase
MWEPGGRTTPTDPRSRRIRASRRGGHLLTRAQSASNNTGLPSLRSLPDAPRPGRSHRTHRPRSAQQLQRAGRWARRHLAPFIPVTNHLHAAHVRAALAAGKHVVCEKPLGVSSAETVELLEFATASRLVHATNFNLLYPQVLEARARIASGALGDIRLVSGGYLQDWLLFPDDWKLDPELGGPLRAVADIGSHWIDIVGFITGRAVEEVCADLATFMPVRLQPAEQSETFGAADSEPATSVERTIHTEDAATILLRLQGGARAVCAISQVAAGRKNRLTVEIERPEELWIGHRDRPNELLLRNPALATPQAATAMRLPAGHAEGFADTFVELYRRVYMAIAAGGPPAEPDYPTFADGHLQSLIGEAIARSATKRGWTTIAQSAPH